MSIQRSKANKLCYILTTVFVTSFAPSLARKYDSDCGPLPNSPSFSEPISEDLKPWFVDANASIKQSVDQKSLSVPQDEHLGLAFLLSPEGKILDPIVFIKADSEETQKRSFLFLNSVDSLPKPAQALIGRRYLITFRNSYKLMVDFNNNDERFFQDLKKQKKNS
jgi:hypothetical protein